MLLHKTLSKINNLHLYKTIQRIINQNITIKHQIGTPANTIGISQSLVDKDSVFTSSREKGTTISNSMIFFFYASSNQLIDIDRILLI